ncbi:MAG TPA: 50S ribosomal protein L2 [Thermoanaerobaculia bacterium]|nr:50S ribosomal protein L2 [Thermoanaerobaculia bacterium]
MAIKQRKPTNAASRFQEYASFDEITRSSPHKALTEGKSRISGRNNQGQQTIWFRGGGHKRRYRIIDFRRDKHGVPATVASIEYDPNRSARIALLHYADGEKRYILAPLALSVGSKLQAGQDAEINVGNALPLRKIPLGTMIHNIELKIGRGGQLARSAGAAAQLMAKEGSFAQIRLPSGEVRKVHLDCYATIGQIGNVDHANISAGKAGRTRWKGRRPHNRGVVMNPVDHPMGGGEGKSSGGRHPTTPWGTPTKGYKTRRNKRTLSMIIRRRKAKK